MGRIEKTVFISYRRTNIPWALAIFHNLTHHGYDVFFDFNGIASGDFERVIIENINARAHFLVLLAPSALERCNDPEDLLRREIETAIETRRNIVPLMLESFDVGAPAVARQLTGSLAALKRYNALNIPADYFDEAMDRLRARYLNVSLDTVLHPVSPPAGQAAKNEQVAASTAPPVTEEELTAQEWFERGYKSKDPDEKLRFNSNAIRLNPNFAEAYVNRGVARKSKGDLEGAIQDYNEAIRLDPNDADSFNNRGNARKIQGDADGALLDFNEAIRLKPDYAFAFHGRGVTLYGKGDMNGALLDFNEAIRLKPNYPNAFYVRAMTRKALGDLDGALLDYNEAIRLKPDDADSFNGRAIVRKAQGDVDAALLDYNEAIRLKPDDANFFRNRGMTRHDKEDLDGALLDYNEAIRLKPDNANTFYDRADLWRKKNQFTAAISDFQKYLDLGGGQRNGDTDEVEQTIRNLSKSL